MREPRYKAPSAEDIVDRQFLIKDNRGNIVVNDNGRELVGAVIDDRSIVKRHLGKLTYAAELSAGVEQLLHPEIGAAVEHTGKFWKNPYGRVAVSIGPIMAVVHADDPRAAGSHVQRMHQGVNGTDGNGYHYNSLRPSTFYYAHETFRTKLENAAKNYSRIPFTDADRELLALESVTWYSYYSMPMNMVPADAEETEAYREYMINNVLQLEKNPSAERAIDVALSRKAPRPEGVPRPLWKIAELAVAPLVDIVGLVTIGELDPRIREKFGIPFSREDQKRLDEVHTIAQGFIDPLPDPLRYSPMAYESLVRDRGGHKNARDRWIHAGMSLGATSMKMVASPVLKLAA